ncbi:helix-turn-helix domain-containing protein [Moritella marina]|uniref:helix-turn-helix domain-containing protein n=1 Tax=Moritella marina TaxID=90736 RepID=UPI0037039CFE
MNGSVLKEAREAINLSQNKIAEAVGVTKQTYLKWENDVTEPKASQVTKLAKALSISETEICQGKLNSKMPLEKFIVQLAQIGAGSSLEALRIWEQIPDHGQFLLSLVDGDISKDKEDLIDALS